VHSKNRVRTLALASLWLAVRFWNVPAANGQSFDAASVKPSNSASAPGPSCGGGPGTADPGLWRCSNMPLALVISKAFGFPAFRFSTHDPCCLARFDFAVRVPEGVTKDQFGPMLQNLLRERFKLAFHYQRKEMAIYELTVATNGPRMKPSPPGGPGENDEPWWVSSTLVQSYDKDGYPVFPVGGSGLASSAFHNRWTAFNVSTQDIAETLSDQSGRPVVDATGLKGTYDIDLKWVVDSDFVLSERAKTEIREQVGELPDTGSGPTLVRAVLDQLGLKMNSKKGTGEIVVIDHVEKAPAGN
jgi:uncharacterized protein (TIGR03435 family)